MIQIILKMKILSPEFCNANLFCRGLDCTGPPVRKPNMAEYPHELLPSLGCRCLGNQIQREPLFFRLIWSSDAHVCTCWRCNTHIPGRMEIFLTLPLPSLTGGHGSEALRSRLCHRQVMRIFRAVCPICVPVSFIPLDLDDDDAGVQSPDEYIIDCESWLQ